MFEAHDELTALVNLAVKLHPAGVEGVRKILDGRGSDKASWHLRGAGQVIQPDALYSPAEAAVVTPWSEKTFATWRSIGRGPSYLKRCARVLYRGADLINFIEAGERTPGEFERQKLRERRLE